MTRNEILEQARKCVCGDREQDYGSPEQNFQTIASFWEVYLKKSVPPGTDLCILPEDVAAMLALLKIARISSGHAKDDNWIDLAGYAACGGEIQGGCSQEEIPVDSLEEIPVEPGDTVFLEYRGITADLHYTGRDDFMVGAVELGEDICVVYGNGIGEATRSLVEQVDEYLEKEESGMHMPDHPVIRNMERTGYPDGKVTEPYTCPFCGEEQDYVFLDWDGEPVGCENCLKKKRAEDYYDDLE